MGQAVAGGPGRGRRRHRRRSTRTAPPSSSDRWFPETCSLPRLVATDLDGTLVRSDGTVSPYTHEVLAALEDRGVPVVFVTGRPLRWAEEVFEYVGSHGLAVVSNGALVWDVARDEVRPGAADPRDVGLRGLPADARGGARHGVRRGDAGRDRASSRSSSSGTRCPTAPGAAPIDELFDAAGCSSCSPGTRSSTPQEFWDAAEAAVGRPC